MTEYLDKAKTVERLHFHELYGYVTRAQLAAYRRYNVSQTDHDMLVELFGSNSHGAIVDAVKTYSPNGCFSVFQLTRTVSNDRFELHMIGF